MDVSARRGPGSTQNRRIDPVHLSIGLKYTRQISDLSRRKRAVRRMSARESCSIQRSATVSEGDRNTRSHLKYPRQVPTAEQIVTPRIVVHPTSALAERELVQSV